MRKLIIALLTASALVFGVTATPAQAGTPSYWTYNWCYFAGGGRDLVGVGWQINGGNRRPTQVSYSGTTIITLERVDWIHNGTNWAEANFVDGNKVQTHNWDGLNWGPLSSGTYVSFHLFNGTNCYATVSPQTSVV